MSWTGKEDRKRFYIVWINPQKPVVIHPGELFFNHTAFLGSISKDGGLNSKLNVFTGKKGKVVDFCNQAGQALPFPVDEMKAIVLTWDVKNEPLPGCF